MPFRVLLFDQFDFPGAFPFFHLFLPAVIGLVNLPVIKFSVTWWNTLHQSASLTSFSRMASPAIAPEMLQPLLLMAGSFTAMFVALSLIRLRTAIAERKERINGY